MPLHQSVNADTDIQQFCLLIAITEIPTRVLKNANMYNYARQIIDKQTVNETENVNSKCHKVDLLHSTGRDCGQITANCYK